MKKFIVALFLIFPFVAWAQDGPIGGPETIPGLYTDQLSFTIFNEHGAVVDETIYKREIPISYRDVMFLKYVRLLRCMGRDVDTFIDLDEITGGGDSPMRTLYLQESKGK